MTQFSVKIDIVRKIPNLKFGSEEELNVFRTLDKQVGVQQNNSIEGSLECEPGCPFYEGSTGRKT